ncbi:MAG: cell division protein ZapA [Bacteroidales bacterium]|nr:cell division protein ZapA [Bacteroidales bacterium]
MEDTKTLTLKIVQRDYTVRVKKEDEALFLHACSSIKDCLQSYASKTAHRDKQDLMAMVLLQAFVSNLRQEEKLTSVSSSDLEKAKSIDNLLNEVLNISKVELKQDLEQNEALDFGDGNSSAETVSIEINRKIEKQESASELTLF